MNLPRSVLLHEARVIYHILTYTGVFRKLHTKPEHLMLPVLSAVVEDTYSDEDDDVSFVVEIHIVPDCSDTSAVD